MCDKMAISAYSLKIVEKDPRERERELRKCLIVTNFSTNKKDEKIKLMQNETNLWNIFLVKTKYW